MKQSKSFAEQNYELFKQFFSKRPFLFDFEGYSYREVEARRPVEARPYSTFEDFIIVRDIPHTEKVPDTIWFFLPSLDEDVNNVFEENIFIDAKKIYIRPAYDNFGELMMIGWLKECAGYYSLYNYSCTLNHLDPMVQKLKTYEYFIKHISPSAGIGISTKLRVIYSKLKIEYETLGNISISDFLGAL